MAACSQAIDGGLELGVQAALGGEVVWHSEIDPNASKILAHHWPEVPNLGDITKIDWADVPPVDVLTGGFPCQDVSTAGARAGLAGARSGLWSIMADAIKHLAPRLVVIENVEGLLSATANSNVEPCTWCVGDAPGESAMRALGAVLADLADLGFDAEWGRLGASHVGAPHRRHRVFIIAWPANTDGNIFGELPRRALAEEAGAYEGDRPADLGGGSRPVTLLGTPRAATSGMSASAPAVEAGDLRGRLENQIAALLPTPRAARGASATETVAMLPTPRATEGTHGGPNQRGSKGDLTMSSVVHRDFGDYTAAIERWEAVTGHAAPPPTEPSPRGNPRLSPAFVEFMMGLPAGHVTGVGISRVAQLTALGNGVVPQQADAAIRLLLERTLT